MAITMIPWNPDSYTNYAPTTPGALSYGEPNAGGDLLVSWGASTDSNGDAVTYVLEQSVDGGNVWTQTAAGIQSASYLAAVPTGKATIRYRVRATDGSLWSAYSTGPVVEVNHPPAMPLVSYGPPRAGKSLAVSWSASADPEGDAVTYTLEHSVDGGAWVQDGARIAGTGYTAAVPESGVSLRYRVKAADAKGAESPYSTGPAAAISYNADPALSGTDTDLGSCAAPPSYSYTVEDEDAGDSLTLTESLDGRVLRTVEDAVRAQTYTATISASVWLGLPNGAHTLTIAASDGQGGAALRTLAFTKAEDELLAYRGQSTVQRPNKAQVSVSPNLSTWPGDATVSIYLANNGNDAADDIVWVPVPKESIGDGTRAASYVMLDNTVKGQGDWCLAVKAAAQQGASGQPVRIARLVVNVTGELEVSLDGE